MAWPKTKAPRLHRFLTRRDRPYPFLREILGVFLLLATLIGILFAATGQPVSGGYPVVVVTSGSMMHCANLGSDGVGPPLGRQCEPQQYGRVGTIDPGDLVFVRRVGGRDGVEATAADGMARYGDSGDVIVYRPNGATGFTPIIHRALFWLEDHGDGTYSIPDLGITRAGSLAQPAVTRLTGCLLQPASWSHGEAPPEPLSGFVTRGDNNSGADQCGQQQPGGAPILPVREAWVIGKARGELPWLGLVKLFVDDWTTGTRNYADAGGDSKAMMWVTLGALMVAPWATDKMVGRLGQARDGEEGEGPP